MSIAENVSILSECTDDIHTALINKGCTNIENVGLASLINSILILAKPNGFILEQGTINVAASSIHPTYRYQLSKPIAYILLLWEIGRETSILEPIWCWVDNTTTPLQFYSGSHYINATFSLGPDEESASRQTSSVINSKIFSSILIKPASKDIEFNLNTTYVPSFSAGTGKILIFYSNGE